MAGDQSPRRDGARGADTGWTALGYLIAGMVVWGFLGWLVDRWLHLGGIATAVGVVLGTVGGVYLVVKRFGA
jgi:ATP synthase protein I